MTPSFLTVLAMGMLLFITGGQCLVCSQWVTRDTTLVYTGPSGTCYGPAVHVSGNYWRLCCDRFGRRQLSMGETIEPFISETVGPRSFEKCTRWMTTGVDARIALAEDSCNSSLVSQSKDGEMRICCV
ncbi:unnamed protein product [Rotaria magnacalcarata]|nr:unnamed protein product [Rotaria magnacalcarata]CAF4140441.1 unnamed protein product [Rotaria magnacalcarata]